ncbi:competence/damage-inducible protein A [Aquimarina agarilytica]|uniref:competence/damage-inducible protein A n=1 Tax=Aquimarina agarilytica TaxID=1087449 RepID=UPI0002899A8F|nr:competence/damage-inducible protein A [Aquimarina agarilytica]
MLAEIITIGDEILIGQIVDTNSVFIATELNKIGVDVHQISSIRDDREHILKALAEAQSRVDLVLVTGGLGPTKDDITKHTFCEFFNDTLIENKDVLEHVKGLFDKYIKSPISEVNKKQALVPSKAEVLTNEFGTAPGMWLVDKNTVFVSMPGVPFEMKAIVKDQLIPRLQERFNRPYILHKTILTYGMGESRVAERIEDFENNLPTYIKLAYLPSLGRVRLRLSARGDNEKQLKLGIAKAVEQLKDLIGDIIVGFDENESLEHVIANLLTTHNFTLALAESCTGGKIARGFTKIGGASAYFKGGLVPYDTALKTTILGVPKALIEAHSVVSTQVAASMAEQSLKLFQSDFAIATTGNAGPTKGDSDAEVGTVCIAIASPKGVVSEQFVFSNHRERTIGKAVNKSLELLQEQILAVLGTAE